MHFVLVHLVYSWLIRQPLPAVGGSLQAKPPSIIVSGPVAKINDSVNANQAIVLPLSSIH